MALRGVTVAEALDSARIPLRAAGCDTPELDAELLLADSMGASRAELLADPQRELGDAVRPFQDAVARRTAREPVAYILGRRGFRRLELAVDPRVLVPRPETELLVELAVAQLPAGARVLDVGTGSGAVALALADERPDLRVTGSDASPAALQVARSNAERLELEVGWARADLLEGLAGPWDAVVGNPPYVAEPEWLSLAPEIQRHEPADALLAGPDGLDVIRRLVRQAAAAAAWLALEVGAGQAAAVRGLVADAGYAETEIHRDLAGIERVVVGRRC